MASKDGGNGSAMLRVLREIRDELREVRGELFEHRHRLDFLSKGQIETNTKLAELKGEVQSLKGEVQSLKGEVTKLNSRFDNFLTGEHRRDHDELRKRVERLEAHAGIR
jgi:predicted nuclease with TOPRIM domain